MPNSLLINQTLLDGVSAINTVSMPIGPPTSWNLREVGLYFEFSAGSSLGVVTVEAAATPNYTGTWASLKAVSWGAANACKFIQITGVHGAIRVRISTAIVGGTVTVKAIGN